MKQYSVILVGLTLRFDLLRLVQDGKLLMSVKEKKDDQ